MSRWLAALVLCACLSCKGEDKGGKAPDERPIEVTEVEAERGKKACERYKQKICECAEASNDAEQKRECRLADVRIDALDEQIRVLASGGDLDKRDRAVVYREIQNVIKGCFEDASALETSCPKPQPPPTK